VAKVVNRFGPQQKKANPVEDMYNLRNSAITTQAGDYDDIMSKFRNIYADATNAGRSGGGFTPYTADQTNYAVSPDTTRALASLRDLTETGGLSGADQQNLRARGVSPIRAMYANAQRDMDRQRRLGGGYSPNYGAVTARFARDQSSLMADQLDKVNAGIAEMVQKGKLSAAPQYAGAAQSESDLKHKVGLENTAARNDAKRFNAQGIFEAGRSAFADRNAAARGMTDLYGTTPALANTYGNQALDTAQFQNTVNEQKRNRNAGLVRSMFGR
jgi:hypothetical protein